MRETALVDPVLLQLLVLIEKISPLLFSFGDSGLIVDRGRGPHLATEE